MADHFKDCKVCGLHCSSSEFLSHKLTCPPKSQKKVDVIEEDAHLVRDPRMDADETTEIKNSESQNNVTISFPSTSGQTRQRSDSTATGYGRGRKRNLFPPTKKYHYYPVTCEYCMGRFQPNELKSHQDKQHFKETNVANRRRRAMSAASQRGYKYSGPETKKFAGIPSGLRNCYLCGKLYGSKSIKIHEPKCLEKWRVQNNQLPRGMRVPEPVKPVAIPIASTSGRYSAPDIDPVNVAAYQSFLQSLIPCTYCARTFSPDRVMKHQSCCIERPKTRQYMSPAGGEIPR